MTDRSSLSPHPCIIEVLSLSECDAVKHHKLGIENGAVHGELGHNVVPGSGSEGHSLAFALDHQTRGN